MEASTSPSTASTENLKREGSKNTTPGLETITLGVWTVTLLKGAARDLRKSKDRLFSSIPDIRRLFLEVLRVDPWAFAVLLLSRFFHGIEASLLLHLSARLLQQTERMLVTGKTDMPAILSALTMRLACVVFVQLFGWWSSRALPRLKTRLTSHFDSVLLQAKLHTDLTASQDASSKVNISAGQTWQSFEHLVQFFGTLVTGGSMLMLIVDSSRTAAGGGPLFPLLCLAKPLCYHLGRRQLWTTPHIVHTENEDYKRSRRLKSMADNDYREEVISSGIGAYVIQEYKKAIHKMNGVSDEYPELQYRRRSTPTFDVVSELLDDLPTIYCVLYAAYNPAKFSVTSIAILQQISQNFRWTVLGLFQGLDSFGKNVYQIKQYYEAQEVPDKGNAPTDGYASYPLPTSSAKGMGFELENVTFAYPGSTEQEALRNITISIHPGQLVVIVGANGSGKSTLIKLLARLYDPTSGTLTVDGEPISVYHKHTLRQATAVLSQDHCLFPMSVGENIGLGCPERVHDVDAVRAAAKAGGASTCIAKLKHRLDTVLDPGNQARGSNLSGEEGEPLRAQLEALDKKVDISGGETQRIVAARTFMRFSSGKVRAVLVDEPSSALDPEGELVLFDNLRNEREGKTMVFVTHRFGHLTKHADLIICMKEGSIAEYGLHQELMARDGEYRKLYEIQANAFSTDTQ